MVLVKKRLLSEHDTAWLVFIVVVTFGFFSAGFHVLSIAGKYDEALGFEDNSGPMFVIEDDFLKDPSVPDYLPDVPSFIYDSDIDEFPSNNVSFFDSFEPVEGDVITEFPDTQNEIMTIPVFEPELTLMVSGLESPRQEYSLNSNFKYVWWSLALLVILGIVIGFVVYKRRQES